MSDERLSQITDKDHSVVSVDVAARNRNTILPHRIRLKSKARLAIIDVR